MRSHNWFTLVYADSDADAQEKVCCGLGALVGVDVRSERRNGDHVLVVECRGSVPAATLHDLIVSIDPGAELRETYADSAATLIRPGRAVFEALGLGA